MRCSIRALRWSLQCSTALGQSTVFQTLNKSLMMSGALQLSMRLKHKTKVSEHNDVHLSDHQSLFLWCTLCLIRTQEAPLKGGGQQGDRSSGGQPVFCAPAWNVFDVQTAAKDFWSSCMRTPRVKNVRRNKYHIWKVWAARIPKLSSAVRIGSLEKLT